MSNSVEKTDYSKLAYGIIDHDIEIPEGFAMVTVDPETSIGVTVTILGAMVTM